MEKASLKKRIIAYIIDMFIVGIVISFFSTGYNSNRIDGLNSEMDSMTKNYLAGEITSDEYVNGVSSISYDIGCASASENIIYVVICVGYFVFFQFLNNGASIGKKIVHIKIVDKDKKNVSLLKLFVRTSFIDNIVPTLVSVGLLYISKGLKFALLNSLVGFIYVMYVIISIFMIKFRSDKLALNDIMSNSIVVCDK